VSHTDPLAEFDSLAEALDAAFGRALNLAGPNELALLVNGAQTLLLQLRRQPSLIEAEIFAIDQRLHQARLLWERPDPSGRVLAGLDARRKACEATLRRAEQLIPRHEANLRSLRACLEEEQRRSRPVQRILEMMRAGPSMLPPLPNGTVQARTR
jgi:hypothetical protein